MILRRRTYTDTYGSRPMTCFATDYDPDEGIDSIRWSGLARPLTFDEEEALELRDELRRRLGGASSPHVFDCLLHIADSTSGDVYAVVDHVEAVWVPTDARPHTRKES